jgi:C4-dicarboxylate-specific signal transduction histidine kinase
MPKPPPIRPASRAQYWANQERVAARKVADAEKRTATARSRVEARTKALEEAQALLKTELTKLREAEDRLGNAQAEVSGGHEGHH